MEMLWVFVVIGLIVGACFGFSLVRNEIIARRGHYGAKNSGKGE